MDRTTTRVHGLTGEGLATARPPQRRWSDGPNYAWSPATEEDWSIATHWPALVAVLCEQVAGGTNDVTREVERLREEGKLTRADVQALRRSIQSMRSSGIALQQIVRLGAGHFNLSPDRIELGSVCRAAVRERQRDLVRRRVDLSCDLHRAEVWVDGAVAAGLLQAAIDWALSFSHKIRLKVVPGDGNEPARIVIRAALPLASQAAHGNRRMNDNLQWVLLRQLGDCARLPVSRSSSAATESAVIEFPATIASGARIA